MKDSQQEIPENNGSQGAEQVSAEKADIDAAKNPLHGYNKQNIIIIAAGLALVFIGYMLFSGKGNNKKQLSDNEFPILQDDNAKNTQSIAPPTISAAGGIDLRAAVTPPTPPPSPKPLPEPQKPAEPTPPVVKIAEPPKLQIPEQKPAVDLVKPDVTNQVQSKQTRMKSSMILSAAGTSQGTADSADPGNNTKTKTEVRTLRHNFDPTPTGAVFSKITRAGNMSLLITQGKLIDAVLETPVNTNYPGPIRAIISKDVYSEQGENVLIPKGSRVIGTATGGYKAGQDRITVVWNRLILPSGFDIVMKDAQGTDKLGQIGVSGDVNRQFFSTIGSAILLSAINVAIANKAQSQLNIGASTSTTTVDPSGNQTTVNNTTPAQQATQQAIQNLGNTTQQWVQENFIAKPYIVVDQGTVVKIFVNQDVVFPEHLGRVSLLK